MKVKTLKRWSWFIYFISIASRNTWLKYDTLHFLVLQEADGTLLMKMLNQEHVVYTITIYINWGVIVFNKIWTVYAF